MGYSPKKEKGKKTKEKLTHEIDLKSDAQQRMKKRKGSHEKEERERE